MYRTILSGAMAVALLSASPARAYDLGKAIENADMPTMLSATPEKVERCVMLMDGFGAPILYRLSETRVVIYYPNSGNSPAGYVIDRNPDGTTLVRRLLKGDFRMGRIKECADG